MLLRELTFPAIFAALFVALSVSVFLRKSPTYDESIHLYAGYTYLKWGDFRVNPEHPPLAKALAALPLLALDVNDPRSGAADWEARLSERDFNWWREAHRMVFLENDAETFFFYAKLPLLFLGAGLGIFVFLWARRLYGIHAGIAAAFIYFLDPNILAHSAIIHTDLPFTAFFFIGTYFYCRTLTRLNGTHALLTSTFFGLAAISKFSFWTILPIWAGVGIARVISTSPMRCSLGGRRQVSSRWEKAGWIVATLLMASVSAYVLIWVAYGLRFSAVASAAAGRLPMADILPESTVLRPVAAFSIREQLFPEAWLYGLLYVVRHLDRPTYLLGEVSKEGFWSYFPVAFLVKTPVPTLILLLATGILWIRRRGAGAREWFLLVPVIVYFAFAVGSRLNIGWRHILPIYPFLSVIAGGTAAELWRSNSRALSSTLVFLGLWYAWTPVHAYPHYLSYFNELVGGSKNGYRVLTDSSLDWGQDLKGLKKWMDENGVEKIQLAYFGTADPAYYGIDAVYMPGSIIFSPRPVSGGPESPEYFAVSVTYVYGVHSGKPLGNKYVWLREKEPVARIGHSILVFKVKPKERGP